MLQIATTGRLLYKTLAAVSRDVMHLIRVSLVPFGFRDVFLSQLFTQRIARYAVTWLSFERRWSRRRRPMLWQGPGPPRLRGWPQKVLPCWLLLTGRLARRLRKYPCSRMSLLLHARPRTQPK
jgi:hypothetical protein